MQWWPAILRTSEVYDGYSFPVEPEPESPESIDFRQRAGAAIQRGLRRRKAANRLTPSCTLSRNL